MDGNLSIGNVKENVYNIRQGLILGIKIMQNIGLTIKFDRRSVFIQVY
jgi:hypothetical protein